MQYTFLSDDEQKAIRDARLAALEREHYEHTLNLQRFEALEAAAPSDQIAEDARAGAEQATVALAVIESAYLAEKE